MSDEEKLGYIGALQARWAALVTVLVDKGLVTREEIAEALDREVTAALERAEAFEDEEAAMELDEDDD